MLNNEFCDCLLDKAGRRLPQWIVVRIPGPHSEGRRAFARLLHLLRPARLFVWAHIYRLSTFGFAAAIALGFTMIQVDEFVVAIVFWGFAGLVLEMEILS